MDLYAIKRTRRSAPTTRLVVLLFMALLIVPLSAAAQPGEDRIIFVLGTDENWGSLNNASTNATVEVGIYNASQARLKNFGDECVVFLASLDNETVESISGPMNSSAHIFAYNLSSEISIGNVEDANITNYWVYGGDENISRLITYLDMKFSNSGEEILPPPSSGSLQEIKILFILLEDTIHRYYLEEAMKNCTLKNTTINLTIYNRDQASENDLTSFDIIALYHLSYVPAVQERLDEANSTSRTIYLS